MKKEFEVLSSVRQFVLKYARFENVVGDNANGSKTLIELDIINKALTELQDIKEAKPSEAMEKLENIEADLTGLHKHVTEYDDGFDSYLEDIWHNINTIKQALQKAQENEKEIEKLKEWFTDLSKRLESRYLTYPAQIELAKKVLEFLNEVLDKCQK